MKEVKIEKETFDTIDALISKRNELGYESVKEFVVVSCFILLWRHRYRIDEASV